MLKRPSVNGDELRRFFWDATASAKNMVEGDRVVAREVVLEACRDDANKAAIQLEECLKRVSADIRQSALETLFVSFEDICHELSKIARRESLERTI